MIAHWQVAQGTEEWHRLRYGKIGGTSSGGLFVKTDTLLLSLIVEITEPFTLPDEEYVSAEMIRGMELEPIARRELSLYTGTEFKECGWLQSVKQPLLGISPDGVSEDLSVSCEIKCPGGKKHIETILDDAVPLDNMRQCLHYFTVNPALTTHYFCSFRPESIRPIFVKKMTRSSLIIMGTEAKPVMMTVDDASKLALVNADVLQTKINEAIKKLSF